MRRKSGQPFHPAVVVGGAFTDAVARHPTARPRRAGTALTTRPDVLPVIPATLRQAGLPGEPGAPVPHFVNGSTQVIDALARRRSAHEVLIAGNRCRVIHGIGPVDRPRLRFRRHESVVPRRDRLETRERSLWDGRLLEPIDQGCHRVVAAVHERKPEAVARCVLHTECSAGHEFRVRTAPEAQGTGWYGGASHEAAAEYRELKCTSTRVTSAFTGLPAGRHLGRLEAEVDRGRHPVRLGVTRSDGGLTPVLPTRRCPVESAASGPDGGVIGAKVAAHLGWSAAVSVDKGGTTAKTAVLTSQVFPRARGCSIGPHQTELPRKIVTLETQEAGTGGGSFGRCGTISSTSTGSVRGPVPSRRVPAEGAWTPPRCRRTRGSGRSGAGCDAPFRPLSRPRGRGAACCGAVGVTQEAAAAGIGHLADRSRAEAGPVLSLARPRETGPLRGVPGRVLGRRQTERRIRSVRNDGPPDTQCHARAAKRRPECHRGKSG